MNINRTQGWIKLHKSVMQSDIYSDANAWRVFTTMLLLAHHEDNQGSVKISGKQLSVNRGQFVISRSELAHFVMLPDSTIRNTINRLKQDGRVDSQSDNHKTLYTICKWDEYQSLKDDQMFNQRTTGGQPEDNPHLSQKKRRSKEVKNTLVETQSVYDLFVEKFHKNPNTYKLTDKRKLKIQARLKDAGLEMLTKAITNTASSSFHTGDNDRGWHADLDFIVRSYEQVERLASMDKQDITNLKPSEVEGDMEYVI